MATKRTNLIISLIIYRLLYYKNNRSTSFDQNDPEISCEKEKDGTKWLVAGLGNPGSRYRNSPHNIGREMIEQIVVENNGGSFSYDKRSKGLLAEVTLGGEVCVCLLPETYMNRSGESVAQSLRWLDLPVSRLVVIHDDLDLERGRIKITFGRGSGGHNGVISIIDHLKTQDFIRLRIGVKPLGGYRADRNYLLSPARFDDSTKNLTQEALSRLVSEGLESAMSEFNQKNTGEN